MLQEQRTWDVVFSHLAVRNLLGTVLFVRARQVARAWLEAVNKALPLLASLSFPVHAKATDVVNVLMWVAGNNLKAVCLEGCLQLSAVDVERILQCLAGGCPAVVEVNLAGCRDEAILRALATAAKRQFSAISPEDLRAMLLALAAEDAASRCPLERLLLHLTSPRLRVADVGRDFAPGRDALRQAVECAIEDEAAVYDVLVLLILTFCAGEDEETITFDCNQRILADDEENEEDEEDYPGKRALHLAAERGGPLSLLLLLLLAGAEVNAEDVYGKTPLHSAAIAGSEAACRVLLEHGAEVNAQDQRGETPAHVAAKGGHGEALKLVVAAGADVNGKDKVSASGSVQRMLCCRRGCECVAGETCWGVSVVDAHTSQQQHSADEPLLLFITCLSLLVTDRSLLHALRDQ